MIEGFGAGVEQPFDEITGRGALASFPAARFAGFAGLVWLVWWWGGSDGVVDGDGLAVGAGDDQGDVGFGE